METRSFLVGWVIRMYFFEALCVLQTGAEARPEFLARVKSPFILPI